MQWIWMYAYRVHKQESTVIKAAKNESEIKWMAHTNNHNHNHSPVKYVWMSSSVVYLGMNSIILPHSFLFLICFISFVLSSPIMDWRVLPKWCGRSIALTLAFTLNGNEHDYCYSVTKKKNNQYTVVSFRRCLFEQFFNLFAIQLK